MKELNKMRQTNRLVGREDPNLSLAPDVLERVHQTYTVFNNS